MGMSGITSELRLDDDPSDDMNHLQTTMVPFPRLHFMTPSMAGIYSGKPEPGASLVELGQMAVAAKNFQVNVPSFDPVEDKYMALNLQFRGTEKVREAREAVNRLKVRGEVSFVEWIPTGFTTGCRKNT